MPVIRRAAGKRRGGHGAAGATGRAAGHISGRGKSKTTTGGGKSGALVGIVMGSKSDWPTMAAAAEVLGELGVAFEARVVSAHRTPDMLYEYATTAAGRGLRVIIAGAGGAAHLPGMLAAISMLPVLGVPVASKALKGLDSLLSIAQMPAGVPVATLAIGPAGAANAGLLAAQILALSEARLAQKLKDRRVRAAREIKAQKLK